MPVYEAGDFSPPAPVVRSLVRGPSGHIIDDVPLLLDTGADVSILPLHVAKAVEAVAVPSDVPILFFNLQAAALLQAELQIEFLRYRFRGTFLLGDSPYGVVGRNILNLLMLTLDGPRQVWSA